LNLDCSFFERIKLNSKCVQRLISDVCPPNEEYRVCGNVCQEICTNRGPLLCHTNCTEGCFCKKGYVRFTRHGQCVPEDSCKRKIIFMNK
uniref:TIL domain-containing protein n=1 Tax=Anisakis simplex TaxID=6269 RepID=A0A0M3IYJ5_ANISI